MCVCDESHTRKHRDKHVHIQNCQHLEMLLGQPIEHNSDVSLHFSEGAPCIAFGLTMPHLCGIKNSSGQLFETGMGACSIGVQNHTHAHTEISICAYRIVDILKCCWDNPSSTTHIYRFTFPKGCHGTSCMISVHFGSQIENCNH